MYIYMYIYCLPILSQLILIRCVPTIFQPQTASGLISGLARFLGRRQLPPRRSALPTAQLQGVARLIPKNLALLGDGGWSHRER